MPSSPSRCLQDVNHACLMTLCHTQTNHSSCLMAFREGFKKYWQAKSVQIGHTNLPDGVVSTIPTILSYIDDIMRMFLASNVSHFDPFGQITDKNCQNGKHFFPLGPCWLDCDNVEILPSFTSVLVLCRHRRPVSRHNNLFALWYFSTLFRTGYKTNNRSNRFLYFFRHFPAHLYPHLKFFPPLTTFKRCNKCKNFWIKSNFTVIRFIEIHWLQKWWNLSVGQGLLVDAHSRSFSHELSWLWFKVSDTQLRRLLHLIVKSVGKLSEFK